MTKLIEHGNSVLPHGAASTTRPGTTLGPQSRRPSGENVARMVQAATHPRPRRTGSCRDANRFQHRSMRQPCSKGNEKRPKRRSLNDTITVVIVTVAEAHHAAVGQVPMKVKRLG